MANRKYRHNANELRTSITVNGDITGYESLFKFSIAAADDSEGNLAGMDVVNLFGSIAGVETGQAFNYELSSDRGLKQAYKADGTEIDSVFGDIDPSATFSGRMQHFFSTSLVRDGEELFIHINGQFGQFNMSVTPSTNFPKHSGNSFYSNGALWDQDVVRIYQWGNKNKATSLEQFCETFGNSELIISATDELQFSEGCNVYKAFKGTSSAIFTADALASVKAWDSDKFGRFGRIFEDGADQPNLNNWSLKNDGNSTYAFYMRQNVPVTNRGANMVPNSIVGWAGYHSIGLSDSFQGATGIHNWEKVNTSQCTDMQYFAWQNTRSKSLGTMRNLTTSKVENFTAMFGHTGMDNQGAEGELLVDPSNWDMKSATTLFYMIAQETLGGSSTWNNDLNWKTMHNVVDLHSVLKNRNGYTGEKLDEFAKFSGNVVLFRSAFAGTGINHDFSNWDFSGVDATRTDIQFNENNESGIMGGFVRDCENMSLENTVKLVEALDRPFGQGGLPVSGVDAEIGTQIPNPIQFGTSYETRFGGQTGDLVTRLEVARDSLIAKGYNVTGLDL